MTCLLSTRGNFAFPKTFSSTAFFFEKPPSVRQESTKFNRPFHTTQFFYCLFLINVISVLHLLSTYSKYSG